MKFGKIYTPSLISATWFLGLCLIWDCSRTHATQQHPDEVDSVVRALMTNGFGAVNVSRDRSKGVMTRTGPVQSQERKTYAADLARVNASDYVIANELTVTPPPRTVAQLTVDKYKAMLQAHQALTSRTSITKQKTEPSFYRAVFILLTNAQKPSNWQKKCQMLSAS